MSSHKSALDEASKNVKQANAKRIVGVGLTGQFRLGELCLGNVDLNSLVFIPTIGLNCGNSNKCSSIVNQDYLHSDGDIRMVSDAKLHSKANMYELTLSVPLRWYFMTANAAYGGAFLECGPLICHARRKNNLQAIGTVIGKPFVDTKKGCYANTNYGLVVGLGKTEIYDEHQMTYGVSLHSAFGNAKSAKTSQSEVNLHVSWTF